MTNNFEIGDKIVVTSGDFKPPFHKGSVHKIADKTKSSLSKTTVYHVITNDGTWGVFRSHEIKPFVPVADDKATNAELIRALDLERILGKLKSEYISTLETLLAEKEGK